MKRLGIVAGALAGLLISVGARAQSGTGAGDEKISGVASKDVSTTGFEDRNTPFEKANVTYRFIGARFRYVIVPQFYMNLFGDGGTTVGVPAFGPEFTIRRNGFEYVLSAMYASYAMDPTPFKAKTDPSDAWEIVRSDIKALYLMSDFLWSAEANPSVAFVYGAGFGIAAIFGDIHRNQAYPGSGGVSDPDTYRRCSGPGDPAASPYSAYCGTDNNHYNDYSEPSWANGGSKPIVFPWLALQMGLRWKPARQFMARVDVGWNLLNGPFFGLALNYGL
jgi:hypothetical protein